MIYMYKRNLKNLLLIQKSPCVKFVIRGLVESLCEPSEVVALLGSNSWTLLAVLMYTMKL